MRRIGISALDVYVTMEGVSPGPRRVARAWTATFVP